MSVEVEKFSVRVEKEEEVTKEVEVMERVAMVVMVTVP